VITGLVFRRSLYVARHEWQSGSVNELRELRRHANLTQRAMAALVQIPLNTFRMWDSGLRCPPTHVIARAREAIALHARRREPLPLAELAKELGVHVRTLQAAARTGRLETQFSVRSVFGRPMRHASRAAGDEFIAQYYRCFSGQAVCPVPLPNRAIGRLAAVPASSGANVKLMPGLGRGPAFLVDSYSEHAGLLNKRRPATAASKKVRPRHGFV
jgi:DNA-binding XRE family transcriptional regulator